MIASLLLGVWMAGAVSAPRCTETQGLVVLWHKETPTSARTAAARALADGCFKIAEQFDGTRREATEMAALLNLPLLAVKAVRDSGTDGAPTLVVGLDVIDTASEELKVKATADETAPAPSASVSARDVRALVDKALARVRSALQP